MSELLGVDVSHYQKHIDWQKVAKAGKKFAILKCQYEAQNHRKDETFNYNYSESGIYGLARGVYIFIASSSMADMEGDAKSLLNNLNGRRLEYGIWIDLEADVLRAKGKAYIKGLVNTYANIFRSAGYYCGIYCNRDWYMNVIHDDLKANYDFWIARYPKNDTGVYNPNSSLKPSENMAVAWQYSSKGRVKGIPTPVDLDVDYDGVINLARPDRKTNAQIAQEVIDGKWGTKYSKPSRKELITAAGYDYEAIRYLVNQHYKK
ncbi:MAG: hypothetical protein IKE94_09830 [Aeriscardovia sp.]|nr:hypothetical protein [Aeriscardovia sp.]